MPRWACWRAWNKPDRITREPVHPATGKNLKVSQPATWATYDEVTRHLPGRKPPDGIGLVVTAADGLAVVLNAPADLPARLGANVVYVERAVAGEGLTVIVLLGVLGAKTDRFVPLSGQRPYQECPAEVMGASPDAIRTASGREPYQENGQSGQTPYQTGGTNPDERRTLFSSSLPRDYCGDGEYPIRREVDALARVVCEQGKAGDRSRWVYGLIGMFRRHGLTPQTIPTDLLLTFAERVGEDVGAVQRLVLARWSRWRPHKVPLADALKAVHADSSLLTGLESTLTDRPTLLAAGMCKFMGADGHPFPLPGRVLAEVLGLRNQQEGSNVVLALVGLGLIKKVKAGSYASKRAAEYVLVGAVVEPEPAQAESTALTPRRLALRRPGHSTEPTTKFGFPSKLGGYLTAEHYLAEWMLVRQRARENKELYAGFWNHAELGPEYARQVAAARTLLKSYGMEAVCRALRSKDGGWVYSLAAPHAVGLVRAEQVRLERQSATRSAVVVAAEAESAPLPRGPRPHFRTGHSFRALLNDLDADVGGQASPTSSPVEAV
ncbi:MAG: hypothetical protein U0804_12770 [Gemmataceae bacterium]